MCGFIYDRFDFINIISSRVFEMKLEWCRGKCILVDINSFVSACVKINFVLFKWNLNMFLYTLLFAKRINLFILKDH